MQAESEHKYHEVIRQLVPINSLSPSLQEQFTQCAEVVMIPAGNALFEQDDSSLSLFFLLEGDVDFYQNGKFLYQISADTVDARFSLNLLPGFSAIANSRVTLLTVSHDLVDRLTIVDAICSTESAKDDALKWIAPFIASEFCGKIPAANLHKLAGSFESMVVKKGDRVVTQNMPGKYFYIIRRGQCVVTRQNFETNETITLAELDEGNCFGEESLLSDQKRDTSVTMLTSGELMRLPRQDFDKLISQPSLPAIDYAEASARVQEGAEWIDVRTEEEYNRFHLISSRNIPIAKIEQEFNRLPTEKSYIIYCDSGSRSSAALALVDDLGLDVSYLEGGLREYPGEIGMGETWIDGLSERLRDKDTEPAKQDEYPADLAVMSGELGEQIVAIDQRIRDLKELFATENIIAQEWLSSSHTDEPVEDLGVLIEASKKIEQIENTSSNGLPEKLASEDDGDLSTLRKQLENAHNQLQEERKRVASEENPSEQQDLTLKRVAEELEAIKNRLKEQETYEIRRRKSFEQQLATERRKVREQLARFSMGLERQQSRTMEVDKVRQLAALETRQIIEKFKKAHEQYRQRQQQVIQQVRKQLQAQARQVIEKARKAQEEKKQALAALRAMQKQLEELKQKRKAASADSINVPLLLDVEAMGDQISQAVERFEEADSTLSQAKNANERNRKLLDQLEKDESSIRHELADWFDQLRMDRESLSGEEKERLKRVRKIAHEALEEALTGPRKGPDSSNQLYKNFK